MKTIPPAETFIINKMKHFPNGTPPTPKDVEDWLIEFAKLHKNKALEVASNKAAVTVSDGNFVVNKHSIIHSYGDILIE